MSHIVREGKREGIKGEIMKIHRYELITGAVMSLLALGGWWLKHNEQKERAAACAETHYFFTMSNGDKLITVHNPANLMRLVGSPCEYVCSQT